VDLAAALRQRLGRERVREHEPLAPFTTLRVGGPADLLAEVRSADEALEVVRLAREASVKVAWLGGGSNLLVADRGVRGLVVRWHGGAVSSPRPAGYAPKRA
jgi:UDP-N-acetylmuramate dehydrogenase